MTMDVDIRLLIDRSSLGTRRARALRARTTDQEADAVERLVSALLARMVPEARESDAKVRIEVGDHGPTIQKPTQSPSEGKL